LVTLLAHAPGALTEHRHLTLGRKDEFSDHQ
jgi:hypothetical protein